MKWLDRLFGGPIDMAALPAGTKAPEINLPALDGSRFSLQAALKQGPVLAAFYKVSCPVCQYTFPFLERLHKAYDGQQIMIVGISQDSQHDTAAFMKEYGITFRNLLDDPNGYVVSNAYGLTNVPTLFLVGQNGQIEITSVGWVKREVEDVNHKLAAAQKTPPPTVFQSGEEIADFRAG
jgi:peroxiredoxin